MLFAVVALGTGSHLKWRFIMNFGMFVSSNIRERSDGCSRQSSVHTSVGSSRSGSSVGRLLIGVTNMGLDLI
jgi:hypothetical protein